MQFAQRVLILSLLALPFAVGAQTLTRSYSGVGGYGWAVADTPDLDGDGRRDFIVGANGAGQVSAQSSANGQRLWQATLAGSDLGWALSAAGNIDGDGPNDVIAGAPTRSGSGVARLLSGRDGMLLTEIAAPAGSSLFGWAVGQIGDIDADGRGDVLVGAPGGVGNAHIFSGRSGGLIATVTGPQTGGQYGAGIAGLSDLDGDGIREFVVGAPRAAGGRAYVYSGATRALLFTLNAAIAGGEFGGFFVADAGDVDADGISDVYVGAPAESNNNGAAYVFSGRTGGRLIYVRGSAGEGLGCGRSAGDVNGDGHADLMVGSYLYGGAGVAQGGRATVFSGADSSVLARVNGTRARGQFGFDAVGLGDVSGDGRLDFIVASSPANAVDLFAGAIDRSPVLALNAGLSGAWSSPAVSKQGLFFDVQRQLKLITGAWFTHSSLAPASGVGLRWFTVLGPIDSDRAELTIYYTRGAAFDTPAAVTTSVVGTMSLQFLDCTHASAGYVVHENAITGQGDPTLGALRNGVLSLNRVTPDVLCLSSPP